MACFISSAATFEKESFSKENIYIYICVYICLCGGAKRSWMQRTIANDYKQFAFPGPVSIFKENSFIFNRGTNR